MIAITSPTAEYHRFFMLYVISRRIEIADSGNMGVNVAIESLSEEGQC
jgi:hypothetical protein